MMWRETGRTPKFFVVDARIMFVIIPFLLHISLWTLYLMISAIIFFFILAQVGYTVPNAWRRLRVLLLFGKTRYAVPFWKRVAWK